MDWAMCITKGGGSFKSLAVRLAKTVTSESGSVGFQLNASLYLCPSISMSSRIGTKFSDVGLPPNRRTQIYIRKKELKMLDSIPDFSSK